MKLSFPISVSRNFHYIKLTVINRNPMEMKSVCNYSKKQFRKRYFMIHFIGLYTSYSKLAGNDQKYPNHDQSDKGYFEFTVFMILS